ncbi:FxsA family membrane protein [Streptomyces sp. NPDC051130]|uniref:FxsA family membrane protein n=1 Tax=Streptomyces sp. NPDC051130 TaxID=3157223 RepID=UPI00341C70DB
MTTGTSTAPRRRSAARTFLPLALAAWFILEIWLLSLVAGAAGGFTVALLVIGGMLLGGVVIKRAGRRAFRNLTAGFQQAQQGKAPTAQQPGQGNALVMLAGLLLILPGLLSDAVGLLLLLPPVRALAARRFARSLERSMTSASGGFGAAYQQVRIHQPDGKVVRGEVVREDRPQPGPGPSGTPGPSGPDSGYRPPLAS